MFSTGAPPRAGRTMRGSPEGTPGALIVRLAGSARPCARRSLSLVALLASTACTRFDRAVGSIPWFTTMRNQVSIKPFERVDTLAQLLLPPEGSVPVTGREDSLDIFTPAGLRVVDALRDPVSPDDSSLARGRWIYGTYCIVCHGAQGRGDGTVAGRFGYIPDLTQDLTKQRSDGYLYAMLRHGRGVMPRYGDKIRDVRDRWNVVNYVRHLQGAVGGAQ